MIVILYWTQAKDRIAILRGGAFIVEWHSCGIVPASSAGTAGHDPPAPDGGPHSRSF